MFVSASEQEHFMFISSKANAFELRIVVNIE
jgi:hypothetical protein